MRDGGRKVKKHQISSRTITYSSFSRRGMRLVFLPAYSPDLNPIEEAFLCIKHWIRNNRDYVLGELSGEGGNPYRMIWDAVFSVTAEKALDGSSIVVM